MRFTLHAAALAMVAVAAPEVAAAQGAANLSGTWALQGDKSNFGMMPAPQSITLVIDHQEPNLTVKRTVGSAAGEQTSTLVYVVDEKPHKNMAGPSEVTSTLKWEDQALVIVSTVEGPQGPVTITDRYTLTADGKTLNQARTLSAQGQEIAQSMVFAKQP